MAKAHPNVTVLIPFLRGTNEDWLRQAIGSLPVGQRYLLLENDGELHEALNEGLEQAGTEFVFRLDYDDALAEGALDFLVDLAWDVDVTYPTFAFVDSDFKLKHDNVKAFPFCPNRLRQQNFVPGTCLFRPEKALQVGGYRELPFGEDWDLWVRMEAAGARFKAVPEAVYFYRKHGQSRNEAGRDPDQRRALYAQIIGERPRLRATFYYQASFATTYWRCLLPARHLPGQALEYPYIAFLDEENIDFPGHQGAGIWQFPGDAARALLMSEMQERGHRVLVEVDDSYLARAPVGDSWRVGLKGEKDKPSLEMHRRILPWIDGVIVTTEHLAKQYRPHNPAVYVCPNQVDPVDWPEPERPDDGILRIGWFASPSHARDAALVGGALEWASRQPNVEIATMGLNPSWRFRRRHIPWSNDMGVYRTLLGWLDIGLAPVVETPWAVCRSDVKALEYAMAEVCPVLSDAIPYRSYRGPCLRARSAKDFLHHLKHLVRHPDEAKQIAKEAKAHVLEERTVARNIGLWEEAVDGGAASRNLPRYAAQVRVG